MRLSSRSCCCLAVVVLAATAARAADPVEAEELLIGWKGDTYQPHGLNKTQKNNPDRKRWIETIAWKPRAFVYHGFMTPQECDHFVNIGSKRVSQSLVVDAKTGMSKMDPIRTSYGSVFGRGEDSVIASVEERIAQWTHVPPEYGENIQILRYMDGQKYDAHWDWFDDPVHHSAYLQNGNRFATVLLYLGEVEEGGETWLPLADAIDEVAQFMPNASACVKQGIAVRPIKGDALMFFDMDPKGEKGDRKALHASCPTLKGTKWTATKWLHNKPYGGGYNALAAAGKCDDTDRNCAALVKDGQCYKDAETMVGPTGVCRRSCEDCTVCAGGDLMCQRRNMRSSFDAVKAAAAAGWVAAKAA